MVALYVQTLLMLAAAYFVGAAFACLIRRGLSIGSRRAVPAERRVDPLPEAAQRATGPSRFGRAPHAEPPRAAPAPQPAVAAAEPVQDLKRIALIDAALEAGLNKLGVRRYDQIAAWVKPDVQRISEALGLEDRINRENWIEQAQVLAKGGETHYARRRARGEAANAEPTPDEGERRTAPRPVALQPAAQAPRPSTRGAAAVAAEIATATIAAAPSPAPPSAAASPANVSERAGFAMERRPETQVSGVSGQPAAGAMPKPAVPIRPAAAPARDNLLRISAIDGDAEQLLGSQGVARYSDIAQWSPADVARFDRLVGGAGRIQRENWVEQAQILSRGGATAFSRTYDRKSEDGGSGAPRPARLADAIRDNAASPAPKPDLGSLRSVRGQDRAEEPGPEAALRAATQNKIVRSPASGDLGASGGIGVLIEKKLNSAGVAYGRSPTDGAGYHRA
jgi:predicted flap endonuclease-1-like 5' DNA nuclease